MGGGGWGAEWWEAVVDERNRGGKVHEAPW